MRRRARMQTSSARPCGWQLGRAGSRLRDTQGRRGPPPCRADDPERSDGGSSGYAWIAFEGRWGELQSAFYNGPTGPNLKTQWTEPIRWSEGWRERSLTVPAASLFGSGATDFFCAVIGGGSRALVELANHPVELGLLIVGVLGSSSICSAGDMASGGAAARGAAPHLGAGALGVRADVRWPIRPLRPDGSLLLPISALVTLLQALVLTPATRWASRPAARATACWCSCPHDRDGAYAARPRARPGRDRARARRDRRGPAVGPIQAYRLAYPNARPLLAALLVAVGVVSLLAASLFLLPWQSGSPDAGRSSSRRRLEGTSALAHSGEAVVSCAATGSRSRR